MKKFIIAAIAFLSISSVTFAQTTAATKDTKKAHAVNHTAAAKATPAATATANKATTAVTPATSATPTKKDGTPDKRYKANKDAANAKKTHLKADGTPDKRHKENKPQ